MRLFPIALGAAAFVALAPASVLAQSTDPAPDPSHITFTPPKDVKWKSSDSLDQAVIFGDPSKPGLYGILIRWHAGHFSRPHFHNTDRYAYVISGTWWVSSSDSYDLSKIYPMPAGSVVTDLADKVHWDGAKDTDALLELVGMGPVTTTQAEVKK
jgi:hypothetical protein